jgi:hypothetical protein
MLLVSDVGADHLFVAPDRGYEVASDPEVLPDKIKLALLVNPGDVKCALPFMNPITCQTSYFGGIEIII